MISHFVPKQDGSYLETRWSVRGVCTRLSATKLSVPKRAGSALLVSTGTGRKVGTRLKLRNEQF